MKARFDTTAFSGLTLSLFTLAFVYVLALFAGVVEDLITADAIIAVDIRVANIFSVFRTDALTNIFTWITLLGKSQVILVFIFVSISVLWLWQSMRNNLFLFQADMQPLPLLFMGLWHTCLCAFPKAGIKR